MGSRPSQYFRATDAENACADWQAAAGKELKCEKVGEERVVGRKSIKYKNSAPDGAIGYVWIDPKINYVVKWDTGKGGAELHNVAEGRQSADLFVIPKDYEVMEPHRKAPEGKSPRVH